MENENSVFKQKILLISRNVQYCNLRSSEIFHKRCYEVTLKENTDLSWWRWVAYKSNFLGKWPFKRLKLKQWSHKIFLNLWHRRLSHQSSKAALDFEKGNLEKALKINPYVESKCIYKRNQIHFLQLWVEIILHGET